MQDLLWFMDMKRAAELQLLHGPALAAVKLARDVARTKNWRAKQIMRKAFWEEWEVRRARTR